MNLKTVARVSVTATPQRVEMPNPLEVYTLRNTDATNSLYVISEAGVNVPTSYSGTASALQALGMIEIDAGDSLVITGFARLDVVCATGLTATLRIDAGNASSSAVLTNAQAVAALATQTTALTVGLGTAAVPGDSKSVTNASGTLVAANAARKSATITNLSLTQALTVKCGATAVAGKGVVLAQALSATLPGGSVTIPGSVYTGVIDGIMGGADATAGNVAVLEV